MALEKPKSLFGANAIGGLLWAGGETAQFLRKYHCMLTLQNINGRSDLLYAVANEWTSSNGAEHARQQRDIQEFNEIQPVGAQTSVKALRYGRLKSIHALKTVLSHS